MVLDTISREEFDARLDAANERLRQELQEVEEQQAKVEQLLSYYEGTLNDVESELDGRAKLPSRPALLRQRLTELAAKTVSVAASL